MASQRIKGQEVELLLVVNGKAIDTVTDIRSFEVAPMLDTLQEGYLGEKSDRFDEIFKGVRGRMELHYENSDVFKVINSIIQRATRREPGTKINIKAALNLPSGTRVRVQINDAFFGEIPLAFGSRTDYGTVALEFRSSNISII